MKKIAQVFIIIIIVIVVIFFLKERILNPSPKTSTQPTLTSQAEEPKIVYTKPEPLENAVVSATEIVEITFNRPLENIGEFKFRIDPKTDIKIELSSDRKTAKIIPQAPYELGVTYTIFMGPDTKFDGAGNWGKEAIYHFQTVKFRGI